MWYKFFCEINLKFEHQRRRANPYKATETQGVCAVAAGEGIIIFSFLQKNLFCTVFVEFYSKGT